MKKLLALLLALIMCLTMLTACDIKGTVTGVVDQVKGTVVNVVGEVKDFVNGILGKKPPVEEVVYQIDKAEAFLKNMYKDVKPITGDDYEVVGQIRVANVPYTVTWTSSTDEVKIVALENGNYLVDLDENSTKDIPYTLTATITAGNGDTATVVYERKVPDKTAALSWDEYMAAEKGDTVIVKGIVVAMNGKSVGNSRNHLFLADESGKGGYYSYQMPDDYDPVANGVKVGMTVIVTGAVEPYSGMQEIKGGTFTIVDETIKTVEPIDITDFILAGNTDFSEYVALPVTIKGVTIGTQELAEEKSQYLNFTLGTLKSYARTYVTDFPTTLSTATTDNADKAAIDKAHADHFGYTADVTGILILYNKVPYLIPMSTDCFTNFTAVERTPEEKIAAELSGINLPANVGTATVVDLPLTGANYTDVAISWTSDSANAVVGTDGKLTISLADEATTVTLTATLTCGDKTVTETFEIAVAAKPNVVNVVVDAPVVGEEYYFMVYQANLGRNLFITGEMDGYYFATTSDIEAAVKVKVVDAGEGKYDLMVGDKYLGIVASGTYINVKYLDTAPEGKFVWNTEYKTFTTTVNDTEYYFGTYGTFQTFSASKLSYAATSFVAHLIVVKNVGANVVDAPVVGNEYYFMTKQENLNKDLFITGEMNGYYFATTTDVTAAAKVKVIDAGEGKYDLMVGDKYLGIVASGTYINVKYLDAAPENKFTWNTEYKTFVTVVNDTEYYFGTYGTFETFSASKLSYAATSFVAHLIEWVEDPNAAPAEHDCKGGNATCENKAVCDICGKEYGELANHAYEAVVTAPDCVNGGYTTYTCSVCGDSYVDNNTDALGHDEVSHEAQAATCTEKGWDAYVTCSRCDYTTYEEIPALQHADEDNNNVCDREGCEAVLCGEGNHVAGEAVKENEVASTCTVAGSYDTVVYCAACDTEISRETVTVPVIDHTPVVDAAVDATCEGTGLTEGSHCDVCGETLVAQETVDALGHEWNEGEVTKVATYGHKGVTTYTCQRDNTHTKTEDIAQLVLDADATADEIVNAAYSLAKNETLLGSHTLSGIIVSVDSAYSAQYKNVTVTIKVTGADETKFIQCFRMKGTGADVIGVGDTITVTGSLTNYNGTIEFNTGCTLDSYTIHECVWLDATCQDPATCSLCGKTDGETADHVYENGACKVCGLPEGVVTITASKTVADLITEYGWTNSTTKQTFNLDDNVTVKVNGGSNSGKAYDGTNIRIYATDSPAGTLTISVPEGYELVSVKVSAQVGTYAFLYVDGTTTDICNTSVEVSGTSVVLNSVKNGSNGKQVRVTAIEVVYKAVTE